MIFFGIILNAVHSFFITDCDNTIAYYANNLPSDLPPSALIQLPASSGSGKTAYVLKDTVQELKEISAFSTVICASGMRRSTMMQRQPFLSPISYWICENGGRVFYRDKTDNSVKEIMDWKDYVQSESKKLDSIESLRSFASQLASEEWLVDEDYQTMIRVKKPTTVKEQNSSFDSVISRIPSNLKYTFNLGQLDIQLPMCSKLSASTWLMKRISAQTVELTTNQQDAEENDIKAEDSILYYQDTVEGEEEILIDSSGEGSRMSEDFNRESPAPPFVFMGDDDNDVEIAAAAVMSLVASPCSVAMQKWVDVMNDQQQQQQQQQTSAIDKSSNANSDGSNSKNDSKFQRLYVASQARHLGAVSLLRIAKSYFVAGTSNKQSPRNGENYF